MHQLVLPFFLRLKEKETHFFGAYLTRNAMEARKKKTQRQTQRKKIHFHGGHVHYKSERHSVLKLEEAYGVWKRFLKETVVTNSKVGFIFISWHFKGTHNACGKQM